MELWTEYMETDYDVMVSKNRFGDKIVSSYINVFGYSLCYNTNDNEWGIFDTSLQAEFVLILEYSRVLDDKLFTPNITGFMLDIMAGTITKRLK